jgi:folate-binding protein YgfZ
VERLCASQQERPVVVGDNVLDVLRIEAGIPAYLKDFDADTVLQEIDQPDIVSFNKGCYLGQEIVARIHYQGQPSKLLRRLVVPADCVPVAGDEVLAKDDEKSAGRITSVAVSPTRGLMVFAMVKRRFYQPGTSVRLRRDGREFEATVVERVSAPATEDAP